MKDIILTQESLAGLDLMREYRFSYYTLCAIQEVIGYVRVNTSTIFQWMKDSGYKQATLRLDDLGNFVSLIGES
jgi:hypothetical protein